MQPDSTQREQFHQQAQAWMKQLGSLPHADLIERMLSSVLRMSGDDRRADLKIIASTLEELEHAFDVLEKYADARKVSLFGSARPARESEVYQQAVEFSRAMSKRGYMIITGAGPGIMAAGNEGAGRENSFGLSISLPFESDANEFIHGDPKHIAFKYFFTRKLAFLKDTHAVVACPGGYGTHDEAFETLTLVQTGKAQLLPLVFLQPPGSDFWSSLQRYMEQRLLGEGMISPEDISLYKITSSVEEACDEICRFYRRYHSMRFYQGDLLLRLNSPLSPEELSSLGEEFVDLLQGRTLEACEAPASERFDCTLGSLPHYRMPFGGGRYGRLRQLIDRINQAGEDTKPAPPEYGEGGRMPVEQDRVW